MTASERLACPNGTCDGSGVVQLPVCPPRCTLLRHAEDCPTFRPGQCPACAKAELGEDLAS